MLRCSSLVNWVKEHCFHPVLLFQYTEGEKCIRLNPRSVLNVKYTIKKKKKNTHLIDVNMCKPPVHKQYSQLGQDILLLVHQKITLQLGKRL